MARTGVVPARGSAVPAVPGTMRHDGRDRGARPAGYPRAAAGLLAVYRFLPPPGTGDVPRRPGRGIPPARAAGPGAPRRAGDSLLSSSPHRRVRARRTVAPDGRRLRAAPPAAAFLEHDP